MRSSGTFRQHMRAVGLPVNGEAGSGRGNLDYLRIEIKACRTAEFGFIVTLRDFKIPVIGKCLRIDAFGPEAPVGDAGWQNPDESRMMPDAKHITHCLLSL